MSSAAVVGATRGLGAALASQYAKSFSTVYATSRSQEPPKSTSEDNIKWITGIDLTKPTCGKDLASALNGKTINTLIINAGLFVSEKFGAANWDAQLSMYTISSIAPIFVVEALVESSILTKGSKIVMISSEAGSLTLRNDGGGDYGHHASKAALNMAGKQLSFDLKDKGIAVALVHPSFMRTEMTKGVGFDKFWDSGGALKPEDAAKNVVDWVENEFSLDKTGSFWAPRGTRDIGSWDAVMGKETAKEGPVQLPW